MKIDFLITELNVGGAEKALTELALGMHRRGHQVRVLSIGSEPCQERHRLVDRLAAEKVELEFGGFDHWSQMLAARRWLIRRISASPPELCQTFLFHANCLGTFAAKRVGVPHVIGGLRVAESKRIRLAVESRAVRRMSHVVCVSRQVRSFAIKLLSANPQTSSVIPNGVDIATYRDAALADWSQIGWPNDSQVAIFVGRLHPQKGIELIQQQFDSLFAAHPGRRLLMIGDGPLRDPLAQWADAMGPDRVQILPWQNDVAPFLKAATLLMLPSHYEGMPNVVMEAMAAGCVTVCSRVEGSAELLGDESGERCKRQGFLPGDGPAMAQLADAFFCSKDLRQSIARANQQHLEQNYTNRQMIDRYETLYRSHLTANGAL
ncbi:Putative teichuronic acid biosynthesis glycosyltransferase TuaC [Stieleria maiorica]|uniref:Teichuronic acid biosynthesis glycosyltransferase TuaC n=1 Tax=Stieleria maiorica TaxID=2795974 RepID=A0A5B9MBM0_9BACT|nr:glycosyltransferase [Stieleria maiorica]QEF96935.1 Putative teichuronic acid biosynthesis glycosyltransferase TuaC [Stieleria maiorica]